MDNYNFIFSNQPRWRIARHASYWLIWYVFMLLTYHFPTLTFPDWNVKDNMYKVTRDGGWTPFIFSRITIAFGKSLLIAIGFTYSTIYWILPRLIHKKSLTISTLITLLIVATTLTALYYSSLHTGWVGYKRGLSPPPNSAYCIAHALRIFLFNFPTVAGLAAGIRLFKSWWIKERETELIAKEKTSAELQLLKAQIHPHFLFNSLNNIYSFTLEGSSKAPEMIRKLTGLLNYMMYGCNQAVVPLEEEIRMICDFISLEKIRYGDRLKLDVNILGRSLWNESGNTGSAYNSASPLVIAPLLLIPLVENSFKHGTSKMEVLPYFNVRIYVEDKILIFKLINSKPLSKKQFPARSNRGLGLKSVRKRLELLYPNKHEILITEEPLKYSVRLKIILTELEHIKIMNPINKAGSRYEHA